MKELGKVPVEPISFIHGIKQALGIAPKELELSIQTLSAKATLEIVNYFQKVKAIENETNEEAFEVLEKNTPLFIDLIATSVCPNNDKEAKILKASISKHWDMVKITSAVNIIYSVLDFDSMFGTLGMLGRIKTMIKTD